jgi:hypothetical protein
MVAATYEKHPAKDLADKLETDAKTNKAPDLRTLLATIPELRSLIVAAGLRCLAANKLFWDKDTQEWRSEPDGPTQLKAAIFLTSYADGLPMQTTVNLNLDGNKGPTLEEAAAQSPALVEALGKALAAARKRQPRAVKQAEQLD